MRALIAAAGLLCLVSTTCARADEIKDLDKWTTDFTDAAGRTDTDAMLALIRPYIIPGLDVAKLQDASRVISNSFRRAKLLHVEQFDDAKIGNFARRINVAVIYDIGPEFYSATFLKGESGWRVYQCSWTTDLSHLLHSD